MGAYPAHLHKGLQWIYVLDEKTTVYTVGWEERFSRCSSGLVQRDSAMDRSRRPRIGFARRVFHDLVAFEQKGSASA
jgi:hypothetical protein